ncbi:MAG: sugar phosphorylase [Lentisphaerae bacterium]|nr:sugar phosphorylase [Lentisphaerota bacterium]
MNTAYERIQEHVRHLYGDEAATEIVDEIVALIEASDIPACEPETWSEKDALCITYADSILGADTPLETLHRFFTDHVGGLINTVHILPFYPFSSDDGFSIIDYDAVREDLGSWDHVFAMSHSHRLVFDCVVNHVSQHSHYMEKYAKGHPDYANFFIEMDPDEDVSAVMRPRTLPLLHEFKTHEGKKWLWTTFSKDQVDLNFRNPKVLIEILRVMLSYAEKGASMLRLDAIPYAWKTPGTSCIHLSEVHRLVKLFRDVYEAAAPHVRLLSETNVPHQENLAYFGDAQDEAHMIYNFTLAPMVLWSIFKGDARMLSQWAEQLKVVAEHASYLNITATHDGIGVRPTENILTDEERRELVQHVYAHGGLMSAKRNSDGTESPYELNISYFDALTHPNSDEPIEHQVRRFLVSQAIPMALVGVPGIYIHSLLGSRSDLEGVERSGRARSINRAQVQIEALERELLDETSLRGQVFAGMKHLLEVRTRQTAFSPAVPQRILDLGSGLFALERENKATGDRILALHNVTNKVQHVVFDEIMEEPCVDLLSERKLHGEVDLAPYEVCWLTPAPEPPEVALDDE